METGLDIKFQNFFFCISNEADCESANPGNMKYSVALKAPMLGEWSLDTALALRQNVYSFPPASVIVAYYCSFEFAAA